MPLLTSPIDGTPMRQINRYGIEIDVCPTTGGIWLDKGELEKLIALLKEEVENNSFSGTRATYENHYSRSDHDDDDDDDRRGYKGADRGHRRKSTMSRVMDIFDF